MIFINRDTNIIFSKNHLNLTSKHAQITSIRVCFRFCPNIKNALNGCNSSYANFANSNSLIPVAYLLKYSQTLQH